MGMGVLGGVVGGLGLEFLLIIAQRSIKNHEPPKIKPMVRIRDKSSGSVSFWEDISGSFDTI
jgi:hypothetical protein